MQRATVFVFFQNKNGVCRVGVNNKYTYSNTKHMTFAIIVPFRARGPSDPRAAQLIAFRAFVEDRFGPGKLWVVTQTPGKKFNRGMLLNVGFLQARAAHPDLTHVIFHDVDLIPSPDLADFYDRVPDVHRPLHLGKMFWDGK